MAQQRQSETFLVRDSNGNPIEYDDRNPADFVVSGNIYPARGPGRTFFKAAHAYKWACEKYGEGNVKLLPESNRENSARWAVLVKGKREPIR